MNYTRHNDSLLLFKYIWVADIGQSCYYSKNKTIQIPWDVWWTLNKVIVTCN